MKKNKNKNFLQDERAVSEVIGFVLLMGIVLSASTIYFSSQIPEWTKDFESRHTDDVADDFSEQKSLIDSIVLKGEEGALAAGSTPIKMAPDKVPILGMSPPGSNLIFNHQDEKFEVIVPVGGGSGGSGNWTVPNATNATLDFTYYHDADNSSGVDVSSDEIRLLSSTTTDLILLDEPTTTVLSGDSIHYYDEVIIENSTLSVANASGVLKIYANNITMVDINSKIIVDGRGNPAGSGTGCGGSASAATDGGGGGAGYGGEGGEGGDNKDSEGQEYGDETSKFIQMGSGGGAGDGAGGAGGAGGGAIWLDAEKITIHGTISANGGDGGDGSGGNAGGGGGGSGGGILICGRDVTIPGTATLSANGGDGGDGYAAADCGGGGGGGGRIKIFHALISTISPVKSVETGGGEEKRGKNGDDGTYIDDPPVAYIPSPTDIAYYPSGYFVSRVYDTGNDSVCYGEMTWDATLNKQYLVMKVRTDWNESMANWVDDPNWDDCPELSSYDGENKIDLQGVSSVSPVAHRYIQFRAELSTVDNTRTPVLNEVKINYSFPAQTPILANATGSIKFNSNYLYYPNQEIVYEHGAVIKWQHEGGFMSQEPPIIPDNETGIPRIRISMVNLTGSNRSYSGATSTSLKNTYQNYDLLADSLKYPNLTINVTTEYPFVWGKWFNKTIQEKGLVYGVDEDYTINYYPPSPAPAENVVVEFYGHGDGVELYLEKTAVEVEI